jgi:saccharopine dehydrogenase-like NADP-dependent oxidoreductase
MPDVSVPEDRRSLIDHYLTEMGLYAKQLCAEAKVEMLTTSYEGEDGHVRAFLPSGLEDSEIEKLEEKLAEKSTEILLSTGLSILVGVFESD